MIGLINGEKNISQNPIPAHNKNSQQTRKKANVLNWIKTSTKKPAANSTFNAKKLETPTGEEQSKDTLSQHLFPTLYRKCWCTQSVKKRKFKV